jgi:hypothetical protein
MTKPKTTPQTQVARFRQAARELETDNNEKLFNEKLGKIARQKSPPAERRAGKSQK